MADRTPAEVGAIVRQRREELGLTQEGCGVSSSLVKQIESGTAPIEGRGSKRATFMKALSWPTDALTRLSRGEEPRLMLLEHMRERARMDLLSEEDEPQSSPTERIIRAVEALEERVAELERRVGGAP